MHDSWKKELRECYLHNVGYAKYLENKTHDLTRYMKQKRKTTFGQQVTRLVEIRKKTSHRQDMKDLIKMVMPNLTVRLENEQDILQQFKEAGRIRMESDAYMKRLRKSEVQTLLGFKEQIAKGRIPDFKPVYDLTDKIQWFRQYPYMERQNLIRSANMRIYEPGEKIFNQGEPSPELFLIIYGSVHATVTRGDWANRVTVMLQTFFDG